MKNGTNGRPKRTGNDVGAPDGGSEYQFEVNFFELGQLLIRKRRWIFGVVIPVMFLAALIMFIIPNVYQSKATVLPSGTTDKMSAIGEMIGVSEATSKLNENSSVLYPLILESNLIKDSVLSQIYNVNIKGKPIRVVPSEYFDEDDPNKLRKCLGDAMMVKSNKRTREIYISVETKYPELSRAMLSEYLRQLENYNRFTRKSSAKENQRYLEKRLVEASKDLEQAEEKIKEFRETNSNWANSTNAVILRDLLRLERNQEIRSIAYLFLKKQLETAKFDAQKDIPIVRVLDMPSLPTIKSGPKRVITIFFAGVISFMLVVIAIMFSDLWRQRTGGNNRESYQTLRRDFSEAFPRSRRMLSLIRRVRGEQVLQSKDKVKV